MLSLSFFQELLSGISEQGRKLVFSESGGSDPRSMEELLSPLLTEQGEASGIALAQEALSRYQHFDDDEKLEFFQLLLRSFGADHDAIAEALEQYQNAPDDRSAILLNEASEPRRQELLRRLNRAPGATAVLVKMRADLLRMIREHRTLEAVDHDFFHLLSSWFNRGFLVLRRIDWSTPASILEKIIRYEAVHAIQSWDDLRRRIEPVDRRCYAFFHPALVDEPLIFVEVALTNEAPGAIAPILESERQPIAQADASTAAFYSISNCQVGLRGISFGNFLIKQVAEDLKRDLPGLESFVTLSPVPVFRQWLVNEAGNQASDNLSDEERAEINSLGIDVGPGHQLPAESEGLLRRLAARYFLKARNSRDSVIDPVARFHLGNGAQLDQIHTGADLSERGMKQSLGLMVNYRYDLERIESNHEAFARDGKVVASSAVEKLLNK